MMNELTALPFLTRTEVVRLCAIPGIWPVSLLRWYYSQELGRKLTQEQTYAIVDYLNAKEA